MTFQQLDPAGGPWLLRPPPRERTGGMAQPRTSAVAARHVVEVEFFGASAPKLVRHLGSLTERHAMRMEIISSSSSTTFGARARITVSRAANQREAEDTVASLVEWVRCASNNCLPASGRIPR